MRNTFARIALSGTLAVAAVAFMLPHAGRAATLACDPDNGGLKLPQGFCALVVAEGLGPARHLAVAANGDVYVALRIRGEAAPGVVALRDTDGDGKMDVTEKFGKGGTGIAIRNGYLYLATTTTIERFKMTPGQLKPETTSETVATGLPGSGGHADKGIAFDGHGGVYVNVGAPSNACQQPDRRPNVAGQDPCQLLETTGGIWKFDENKLGQTQAAGVKYATGMRQMPAITWHDGALWATMNSRDSLDQLWPNLFKAEDNETRAAEPMYRIEQGDNFGWPYCYFDLKVNALILNPEYGGDGKTVGRCASGFKQPIATFPAHWAPVDMMFYTGTQFPARYRNGAFIAFHGSWNRSPAPQDGYNVTFQPFANGRPNGKFETFAEGFAGKTPLMVPNEATARADGVAQGPDGSLYITDSQKGRVWRVLYRGR